MNINTNSPQKESFWLAQFVPLSLTVILFFLLSVVLFGQITLLNFFTSEDIAIHIRWVDVLVGVTIYLKTAIDFAMYIGKLMEKHPGWKARVGIEIGSALGNALGTLAILVVWAFFKEVAWLLALMIVIAGLVLLKLAEESLEHAKRHTEHKESFVDVVVDRLEKLLHLINNAVVPVLRYVIPSMKVVDGTAKRNWWGLFILSFTVPFILGLDDFAGYVSLFSIVNVFGFGVGVFLGHMILNIALYISPRHTIALVKNRWVALLGSIAFVVIALWGFYEVVHLIG